MDKNVDLLHVLQSDDGAVQHSWPVESANCLTHLTKNIAAIGTSNGSILLIDLMSGTPVKLLTGHIGNVFAVDASPNATFLASTGEDSTVRIWGIADGDFDLESLRTGSVKAR